MFGSCLAPPKLRLSFEASFCELLCECILLCELMSGSLKLDIELLLLNELTLSVLMFGSLFAPPDFALFTELRSVFITPLLLL